MQNSSFEKFQRYRLLTSYFSVVISVALVLFLMGILGVVVLNADSVSKHFKERMVITIFINDNAGDIDITHMQKSLVLKDYTKYVNFVSKAEAAKTLKYDFGEDFINFLGKNPLHNSIDIHLNADFVTKDKVKIISESIGKWPHVLEVSYDKSLIELLNKNIKNISFWLLVASGIFGVIALLLINASIRLSIYSQRFVIKTMQLVGANKSFIRRPFVTRNIKLGILGATLAIASVGAIVYSIDRYVPDINFMDTAIMLKVGFGIFATGILVTWLSTIISAQYFLNIRTDNLY